MAVPLQVKNDPVLRAFWKRMYLKDQNVLMVVVGQTGTCKSGSSITIADIIDRGENNERRFIIKDDGDGNPTPETRVVFTAEEFTRLVQDKDLPKGSVIIWDETGVDLDNTQWFALKNRVVKYVMQTFRRRNFMVIMTVPDLPTVSIGTRRLLHAYLDMKGKTLDGNYARGTLSYVISSPKTSELFFPHPRFHVNGVYCELSNWIIPRPDKELERTYKRIKNRQLNTWYRDFDNRLTYMRRLLGDRHVEAEETQHSITSLEAMIMKEPKEFYDEEKGVFNAGLIEIELEKKNIKITSTLASRLARVLNINQRKGKIFIPKEVKEGN